MLQIPQPVSTWESEGPLQLDDVMRFLQVLQQSPDPDVARSSMCSPPSQLRLRAPARRLRVTVWCSVSGWGPPAVMEMIEAGGKRRCSSTFLSCS